MPHHKRRKPKRFRAGCKLCKPHKQNGARHSERDVPSVRRRLQDDGED